MCRSDVGDLDQLIDMGFRADIADGSKISGNRKTSDRFVQWCRRAGRTVLWIGPQQGFIDVRDTVAIGIFQCVFHHKINVIPYTLTEGISDKHATYQLGVGVSGSFDWCQSLFSRGGETADHTA